VAAAPRITVPGADDHELSRRRMPAEPPARLHAALPSGRKEMHVIAVANHYFSGGGRQRAHLDTAAAYVRDWAGQNAFATR
jgi:hypothetical protein